MRSNWIHGEFQTDKPGVSFAVDGAKHGSVILTVGSERIKICCEEGLRLIRTITDAVIDGVQTVAVAGTLTSKCTGCCGDCTNCQNGGDSDPDKYGYGYENGYVDGVRTAQHRDPITPVVPPEHRTEEYRRRYTAGYMLGHTDATSDLEEKNDGE